MSIVIEIAISVAKNVMFWCRSPICKCKRLIQIEHVSVANDKNSEMRVLFNTPNQFKLDVRYIYRFDGLIKLIRKANTRKWWSLFVDQINGCIWFEITISFTWDDLIRVNRHRCYHIALTPLSPHRCYYSVVCTRMMQTKQFIWKRRLSPHTFHK